MSILSSVLCSELVRVFNRMSDRWGWARLCCKCERVYALYGTNEIPTDIDDCLEVFDATDISKNVMRFVVYILWLKRNPIHWKSICMSENLISICGETALINFGDYEEKKSRFLRVV